MPADGSIRYQATSVLVVPGLCTVWTVHKEPFRYTTFRRRVSDVSIVLSLPDWGAPGRVVVEGYGVTGTCNGECQTGVPEVLSIQATARWLIDPSKRKYSAAAVPKVWAGCMVKSDPGRSRNSNHVMGFDPASNWALGMTHTLLYCPTSVPLNIFAVT